MKITVDISGGKKRIVSLSSGAKVIDAMRALRLHPDMHIAFRNGAAIPVDEPLRAGDKIQITCVASGG
jgi:sulfur carrier protein ThiS